MGLLPTDIQTRSQKELFLIFSYFSLCFLTDLILSDRAIDREFQDLSENGPTSNTYPKLEPKKNYVYSPLQGYNINYK